MNEQPTGTTYTGTATITLPCRCGVFHERKEDTQQHECLHISSLYRVGERQAICPLCGASWELRGEETP